MAVRIRKLAKELNRSSSELLGVLHALGYDRYRSPEDMLSEPTEAKLRRGLANGVRPIPVDVPAPARGRAGLDDVTAADDLMARLVPGVVPQGRHAQRKAPRPESRPRAVEPLRPVPPGRDPGPPPPAAVEPARPSSAAPVDDVVARRALDVERAALESERRVVASERAVLATERDALEAERERMRARERALEAESAALARLREALETERGALDTERQALGRLNHSREKAARPLQELLEERGLRGADEFERALIALADARLLRDVLWTLRLDPPDAMRAVLDERLVLGGGDPPPSVGRGAAFVTVAPERAELPDAATLHKLLFQLGERLLLFGCRRVRVVGGSPRWHKLLREGVDPRVELAFQPGAPRTAALAHDDVLSADCVVLWQVPTDGEARAIYESARPVVVQASHRGVGALLRQWIAALDD